MADKEPSSAKRSTKKALPPIVKQEIVKPIPLKAPRENAKPKPPSKEAVSKKADEIIARAAAKAQTETVTSALSEKPTEPPVGPAKVATIAPEASDKTIERLKKQLTAERLHNELTAVWLRTDRILPVPIDVAAELAATKEKSRFGQPYIDGVIVVTADRGAILFDQRIVKSEASEFTGATPRRYAYRDNLFAYMAAAYLFQRHANNELRKLDRSITKLQSDI